MLMTFSAAIAFLAIGQQPTSTKPSPKPPEMVLYTVTFRASEGTLNKVILRDLEGRATALNFTLGAHDAKLTLTPTVRTDTIVTTVWSLDVPGRPNTTSVYRTGPTEVASLRIAKKSSSLKSPNVTIADLAHIPAALPGEILVDINCTITAGQESVLGQSELVAPVPGSKLESHGVIYSLTVSERTGIKARPAIRTIEGEPARISWVVRSGTVELSAIPRVNGDGSISTIMTMEMQGRPKTTVAFRLRTGESALLRMSKALSNIDGFPTFLTGTKHKPVAKLGQMLIEVATAVAKEGL